MRILLLNLPWKIGNKKGVRAGSRWPHLKNKQEGDYLPFPFFLTYTSSLLKKNKLSTYLIDAIAEDLTGQKLFTCIKKINPSIILIETSTPSLNFDLDYAQKIKKFLDTKIVFVGCDANIARPSFLKGCRFVDFVIQGEYEFSFLNLVKNIQNNTSLNNISGLIYRDSKNRIIKNKTGVLCNLDDLPWPDRDSVPIYNYLDAPGGMPLPCAQMLASRGCPHKCVFCAWPQVMYRGANYRARNVKDVVDEMEYLVKEKGFKSIYFDDDTFNIGRARMLKLCKEIKERNLKIPWAIMARADLMDEELLREFKGTGLFAIKYGIESANQKILDSSGKNLNIKKCEKIISITKSLGIKVHLTFMFGLSGETKGSIIETIDFAKKIGPDSVQFSIVTPFPGTQYYNSLQSEGKITSKNWRDYDGNHNAVIRTEHLKENDLIEAQRQAYEEWEKYKTKETVIHKIFKICLHENYIFSTIKKSFAFLFTDKAKGYFKGNIIDNLYTPEILLTICPVWDTYNPSIGLGYLVTNLKQKGHKVDVFDFNIKFYNSIESEDKKHWEQQAPFWGDEEKVLGMIGKYNTQVESFVNLMLEKNPMIIGFSVNHHNRIFTINIARRIREKDPKKIIVFGGTACFNDNEREYAFPKDCFDYFVVGEGEEAMDELVSKIKKGARTDNILGVVKNEGGRLTQLIRRDCVDLKNIIFPTYEEFDMIDYKRLQSVSIITNRGCIGRCNFCNDHIIMGKFRFRAAEDVVSEIEYHIKHNFIMSVTIKDLACNCNVKELEKFAELLIRKKICIGWDSQAIPNKSLTENLLIKLKRSGCSTLIYGLEAGSDTILKKMKKPFTIQEVEGVIRATKRAGIIVILNIMIGFPGETKKEFMETLDFIKRNNKYIDSIGCLSTCRINANSPFATDQKSFGINITNEPNRSARDWISDNGKNTYELRYKHALRTIELCKELEIPIMMTNIL